MFGFISYKVDAIPHCHRSFNSAYRISYCSTRYITSCGQLLLLLWITSIYSAAMSTPVPYTLTSVNKMGKHETSRDILSTSSTTRSTRDMLPTSSTTRSTRDMLSTSSTTRSTRDMLPTSSTTRSTRDMLSTSSTTRSTRDMLPTSSTTRSTPPAQDVCTRPRPSRRREDIIQIGVILPLADHHLWSLKMALPAITLAVEEVNNNTSLLQGLSLVINARDSECSETIGPLAAFDMYVNQSADVFLGPACDYSVAPVARFSKFWGIPVLSAGALVAAFKDKTEYRLLTRVQVSWIIVWHLTLTFKKKSKKKNSFRGVKKGLYLF